MLTELIEKTNKDEFYSDWDLKLESILGAIDPRMKNSLEVNLILENSYNSKIEYWQILSESVLEMRGIFSHIYLPYVKLALLDEHPKLWAFKHDSLECELSGKLENPEKLVSKLTWLYEDQTGNFIKWRKDFHGIRNLINGKEKISMNLNMKTYNLVKELLEEFGLSIEITNIYKGEDKGYFNRPDMKILIFGNPDVSENEYDLGQPFILANNFKAKKIER